MTDAVGFFGFDGVALDGRQTPQVPPSLAQNLQAEQFLQASQDDEPVHLFSAV
jgi:hypothetical protein